MSWFGWRMTLPFVNTSVKKTHIYEMLLDLSIFLYSYIIFLFSRWAYIEKVGRRQLFPVLSNLQKWSKHWQSCHTSTLTAVHMQTSQQTAQSQKRIPKALRFHPSRTNTSNVVLCIVETKCCTTANVICVTKLWYFSLNTWPSVLITCDCLHSYHKNVMVSETQDPTDNIETH